MGFDNGETNGLARSTAWIAAILLAGVLLLPQGVGISLSPGLPRLDLPRLCMLALLAIAAVYFLLNPQRFSLLLRVAPRTLGTLAFVFAWQAVSALMAGTGVWSYYWVIGNFIAFWGFGSAFLMLAGHQEHRPMIARVLIVIALLLAIWSSLEFVTQAKLVPYRNLYESDSVARFSGSMARGILGVGWFPFMSLGPYFIHHILAAVLCAIGGFLIMGPEERGARWYFFGSLLLTFAIFSTQSRSGLVAFAALGSVGLYFLKTWRHRIAIICGGIVALVVFIPLFGGINDFILAFMHDVIGKVGVVDIFKKVQIGSPEAQLAVASVQGRLAGFMVLFSQVDQWWLFGTGPGSMFNQERITPGITGFSEQGSYIWFMVESGLPVGIALAFAMVASLRQGLRSDDWRVRSAAIGLVGFWVFSLLHVALQSWVIGTILIGLIEAWSRKVKSDHMPDH